LKEGARRRQAVPPRIYVVDNGGQWTHREWRVLKYLGADARIVPNTSAPGQLADAQGIVLSGGAASAEGVLAGLGTCGAIVDAARCPVLGICAGHQFLAVHLGGRIQLGVSPEFGATELELLAGGDKDILAGFPPRSRVWENHNDAVTDAPPGFEVLARSATCPVQAMRHERKPLFGVQFHPEVEHTEHGRRVFENFLAACAQH
jgi:GMP synthase (glutamine-hydrolysing)